MTTTRWVCLARVGAVALGFVATSGFAHADSDADGGVASTTVMCIESGLRDGKRPQIRESFPSRGVTGYASTLSVVVEHGKGERVLPNGFDLQSATDSIKELKSAGFVIPSQLGESKARLSTVTDEKQPDKSVTTFDLPIVVLPAEPGRHTLILPPLPVAIARASGEIATVCTMPHVIVVEDPIASTPDAQPKPNPPARNQREEWTSLKKALTWLSLGLIAGAIAAYLVRKWLKRERPLPPPPPPRPPWEVALEQLDEVRHAGLLDVGRYGEYFDRVSDAVRSYLGAMYGFDGLESTSREIISRLKQASTPNLPLHDVVALLQESDLVKFAKAVPTTESCAMVLAIGERIVQATAPAVSTGEPNDRGAL